MVPGTKKKPWWREHLSLKLISLILAFLLELYFYSPDNSLTVTVPITVEIRNVPVSMMFISPRNAERGIPARIEVRGPRPLIEQVRATTQRLNVDYPDSHPPVFSVPLDAHKLWLPAGVEVLEVQPNTLTVELEPIEEKELPVELVREGDLDAGYQLEGVTILPETVTITGPQSEVSPLKAIQTKPVNLRGLHETRRVDVDLTNPGRYTQLDLQTVNAELRVGIIPAEKSFDKVSVKVLAPDGFAGTVEPTRVKVTLVGPKESLEKLSSGAIQLQADGRELEEGKHQVECKAELADGVTLYSTEPKKVNVYLVKQRR